MKKDSSGGFDALQGWAQLYGKECPASDLFGSQGGDGGHPMLTPDPSGHGALLDPERLGGEILALEVLNQSLEDVHVNTSNRNACIVEHRNACLQGYRQTFDNPLMDFKHRVKAARKYAGLTQGELAERVGIKQATVSELETGKSGSSSFTASIAHACGVDPLWLETGSGEMLPKQRDSSSQERGAAPDNGPIALQSLRVQEASVISAYEITTVPLVSWVAAGSWCEAVDLFAAGDAEVWMPCPENIGPRGFALRVEGDSMTSPYPGKESYPHGTIVYVDPDVAYKSGDAVIAKLPDSNEATFKLLVEDAGKTYLQPINPQYPMIVLDRETHICGVVIGSFRSTRR